MADRHVEVIYCDDVRQEAGNKLSLMGIYTGMMYVTKMPVTLPKLCVFVNVATPANLPFEQLRVYITRGDETIFDTGEIVSEGVINLQNGDPQDDEPDELRTLMANIIVELAPFQIDSDTVLRVFAQDENGEMRGRRLRIMHRSLPQTVQQ